MSLRVLLHAPTQARVGELLEIRATAAHPMETGYRRGSDGAMLPRDLLRQFSASFEGQPVFKADFHAAVSANPYVAFWLRVPASGTLLARWSGDKGINHEVRHFISAS